VHFMIESLSKVEREVYDIVLKTGEVMARDIPFKLAGAVPSLVNKGLIVVQKRRIHNQTSKKGKFLILK